MIAFTKATGLMVKSMETENNQISMVKFMRVSGLLVKSMELGNRYIQVSSLI